MAFSTEPRQNACCTVEPMKHDIAPATTSQLVRGTTLSLNDEPYYVSPNAQHNLKAFDHKPKSTRGVKILIIEDDLDLSRGLRIWLQAYYDTYVANDAGAGLSMAFTEMPNVIILDLGLPDYDGYFFMKSLSEIPGLAGVPVIVLTARDRFTHEWRCHDYGAKRFFQKPIDNHSLLVAIEQLVG
jgi:CheY-like chemotaxis protein